MKLIDIKNVAKPVGVFIGMVVFYYIIVLGMGFYTYAMTPKVLKNGSLYVPTGSDEHDWARILVENSFIKDSTEFLSFANKLSTNKVYPGCFNLSEGMSYKDLLRTMGHNLQTPVRLTFNNIDAVEDLAGRLSAQVELDSVAILDMLSNDTLLAKYDATPTDALYMFIPNTYEVYWNVSQERLLTLMKREYDRFWKNRDEKLATLGLTRFEVTTLASIVEKECRFVDEMPMVAGVYINRLNKKMRLQSDPTVKYALGDKKITRIMHKDLLVESPYNTYLNAGLPPTPISLPSIAAIDAVLNYTKSSYLYFCASDKMNMRHKFATSFDEHRINARNYSRALNAAGIY